MNGGRFQRPDTRQLRAVLQWRRVCSHMPAHFAAEEEEEEEAPRGVCSLYIS